MRFILGCSISFPVEVPRHVREYLSTSSVLVQNDDPTPHKNTEKHTATREKVPRDACRGGLNGLRMAIRREVHRWFWCWRNIVVSVNLPSTRIRNQRRLRAVSAARRSESTKNTEITLKEEEANGGSRRRLVLLIRQPNGTQRSGTILTFEICS